MSGGFSIYNPTNPRGQSSAANSIPVTLSNENVQDLYIIGQSAQTAIVNNILSTTAGAAAIDATGYRSALVHVASTATGGTYIFEGSNDNVNFQTIPVYNAATNNGTSTVNAITATAASLGYVFPVFYRYVRLRIVTPLTGGSIQAFSKFMQTSIVTYMAVAAAGVSAHSAPGAGFPVRTGGRVTTTLESSLINNDVCDTLMTSAGQIIQKPYGAAEHDWQYTAAAGGITASTADVVIKAAGPANIRNYITSISISADPLVAATEIVIKEGATIIWRDKIKTTGMALTHVEFPTPLKSAAATALNVAVLTSNAGAVYFNAQGYQSF